MRKAKMCPNPRRRARALAAPASRSDAHVEAGAAPVAVAVPILEGVPLDAIADDPDSGHRLEAGDLAPLTASLRRDGLLQPVILRRSVAATSPYTVVDGRRRIAAARSAGWKDIRACVYSTDLDALTVRRFAAVANLERRDLNPVEEALAVVRLLEALTGRQADVWTDARPEDLQRAADLLGRSVFWVRDRAYLTRLCRGVRAMVADRRLPPAQAREICKLASAEDQMIVADWACGSRADFEGAKYAIMVQSVATVRRNVAGRLSTLRGVPWHLTVPFAGRPACAGCPDNSAHALLFGVDAEDGAPEARCLNTCCYRDKMRAAEKALSKKVADLKDKKGVAATVAGVRSDTPDYLKAATVARKLDQARLAAVGQARGGAPKPKAPALPYHERPQFKLESARREWRRGVGAAVVAACRADPMRMARLACLPWTKTWQRNVRHWEDTATKAVRAKVEPLLAKVVASDPAGALAAIVADVDPDGKDARSEMPLWVLRRLAGLLGVSLPREPVVEDFLPKTGLPDGRRAGKSVAAAGAAVQAGKRRRKPRARKVMAAGPACQPAGRCPGSPDGGGDCATCNECEDD